MVINSDFDIIITNVLSANRLRNSPTEAPILRRNRKYWAVALKRNGRTCCNANGKQVISDPTHPVILPKGCS